MFYTLKKNQEMTMSLLAHRHLLHLRKKQKAAHRHLLQLKKNVENDNKPRGLLLSSTT
jgi:hypothetical protein